VNTFNHYLLFPVFGGCRDQPHVRLTYICLCYLSASSTFFLLLKVSSSQSSDWTTPMAFVQPPSLFTIQIMHSCPSTDTSLPAASCCPYIVPPRIYFRYSLFHPPTPRMCRISDPDAAIWVTRAPASISRTTAGGCFLVTHPLRDLVPGSHFFTFQCYVTAFYAALYDRSYHFDVV